MGTSHHISCMINIIWFSTNLGEKQEYFADPHLMERTHFI